FESVQCAQKAKAALNGADIYAGCCTLKIEYARNDNESWDYTKPYLVRRVNLDVSKMGLLGGLTLLPYRGKGRQKQAILGEHPSAYADNGYGLACPLLPLTSNSRYKLTSVDIPDMVSYPLPQCYLSFCTLTRSVCLVQTGDTCSYPMIPSQVFELEDGSSSYKDFAMTRNNRFSSAGQASKNIIQPPSAVLHYYNVPPCVSQDQLLKVCDP
ncbi:hypothetical protein XENOCAPTIV_010899, partial [Xenoophorus captivus]